MQLYSENKRLKEAELAIGSIRLRFGPNKKQELTRLIYEVSKINNISPGILLDEVVKHNDFKDTKNTFVYLKNCFIKKRYPNIHKNNKESTFYLPKLSLNSKDIVKKKKLCSFYPQQIFVEKDVQDSHLVKSIISKFPTAHPTYINNFNDYIKSIKNKVQIKHYNERAQNLFLIKEKSDFIKPCPCSKGIVRCGYYILNLGFGCASECSYCFLQSYTNVNGIVIPVNIDDYLSNLEAFLKKHPGYLRIGTGEFSDSLALDDLTGFASALIDFFSKKENAILELKTKSNRIENILNLKHNKKTVISWSLNPQSIIDSDEWQTNSLKDRLDAAKACSEVGYPVGFHFDPIVYSENWQGLYKELVQELFKNINHKNIAWISLGTFRFTPKLKKVTEQRFPNSKILDEELAIGFDKKLRYAQKQRVGAYKNMFSWIREYSKSVLVYLCMESREIWKEVLGRTSF